jgi:putative ABC transport system permease protein
VQAFGAPLVDDGSGLAVLLGRDDPAVRAALSAGRAVVFRAGQLSPDGTLHLRVERGDQTTTVDENGNPTSTGTLVRLPATLVELPLGSEQPVLPASAVRRLGTDVTVEGGAVVASTTRMPTAAQEQRLQAELGGEGYAKVERGHESSYSVFLLVIAIASVVVALGSTLAVVGLSAAEGRADVATLAAVGAPPRVRRRLAAAQAGVVALLGTGLGVLSGVVSGITLVLLSGGVGEFDQFGRPLSEAWSVVVPWRELAALGVVIPLLAVVAAAAFTRSRLPLVRRLGQ